MHFLGLLWFSLLQALSLPGSVPLGGTEVAPVVVSTTSWTLAGASSAPLVWRAPAGAAAALVSQPSIVVTPDRSDTTALQQAGNATATTCASQVRSADAASRDIASSRGDLLPYFATAPPKRV